MAFAGLTQEDRMEELRRKREQGSFMGGGGIGYTPGLGRYEFANNSVVNTPMSRTSPFLGLGAGPTNAARTVAEAYGREGPNAPQLTNRERYGRLRSAAGMTTLEQQQGEQRQRELQTQFVEPARLAKEGQEAIAGAQRDVGLAGAGAEKYKAEQGRISAQTGAYLGYRSEMEKTRQMLATISANARESREAREFSLLIQERLKNKEIESNEKIEQAKLANDPVALKRESIIAEATASMYGKALAYGSLDDKTIKAVDKAVARFAAELRGEPVPEDAADGGASDPRDANSDGSVSADERAQVDPRVNDAFDYFAELAKLPEDRQKSEMASRRYAEYDTVRKAYLNKVKSSVR